MVQSRTCVQKVARCHVRIALSPGFKYDSGVREAEPLQEDQDFTNSHRLGHA